MISTLIALALSAPIPPVRARPAPPPLVRCGCYQWGLWEVTLGTDGGYLAHYQGAYYVGRWRRLSTDTIEVIERLAPHGDCERTYQLRVTGKELHTYEVVQ